MSSRNHNKNATEHSPHNHRRTLNPSQMMDSIGRIDDETGQPVDPDKSKITPPASPARPIVTETVEIATQVEVGRPVEPAVPMEIEDKDEADDDDVDADLERLLASSDIETARTKRRSSRSSRCRCGQQGPGNTRILFPRVFAATGWGMLGPHWFGPFFVFLIIVWAAHYFIKLALRIGPLTTATCVLATIWTMFNLCAVSFHDPGIVTDQTPPANVDMSRWRWCDFCKYVES